MGIRRKSRELVIQVYYALLYVEKDENFNNMQYIDQYKEILDYIAEENIIKQETSIYTYAEMAIKNIIPKIEILDEMIERNIGEFKIDKLGLVEQIILRIAIYEMIYDKTPVIVMINEAIELAKKYCAEKSPAIINAILDKIKETEVDYV
jgi:N utilization substance protein B